MILHNPFDLIKLAQVPLIFYESIIISFKLQQFDAHLHFDKIHYLLRFDLELPHFLEMLHSMTMIMTAKMLLGLLNIVHLRQMLPVPILLPIIRTQQINFEIVMAVMPVHMLLMLDHRTKVHDLGGLKGLTFLQKLLHSIHQVQHVC